MLLSPFYDKKKKIVVFDTSNIYVHLNNNFVNNICFRIQTHSLSNPETNIPCVFYSVKLQFVYQCPNWKDGICWGS